MPGVNAGWDAENDRPAEFSESIGVALAIDSAVGLLAPVIRDPDLLDLLDLDVRIRATIERTRAGKLAPDDIRGATTTLSNLGGFGVPSFTSLLTPPRHQLFLSVRSRSVRSLLRVTAWRPGLARRSASQWTTVRWMEPMPYASLVTCGNCSVTRVL